MIHTSLQHTTVYILQEDYTDNINTSDNHIKTERFTK